MRVVKEFLDDNGVTLKMLMSIAGIDEVTASIVLSGGEIIQYSDWDEVLDTLGFDVREHHSSLEIADFYSDFVEKYQKQGKLRELSYMSEISIPTLKSIIEKDDVLVYFYNRLSEVMGHKFFINKHSVKNKMKYRIRKYRKGGYVENVDFLETYKEGLNGSSETPKVC